MNVTQIRKELEELEAKGYGEAPVVAMDHSCEEPSSICNVMGETTEGLDIHTHDGKLVILELVGYYEEDVEENYNDYYDTRHKL